MTAEQIDRIVAREMDWIDSTNLTPHERDREVLFLWRWRQRQYNWYLDRHEPNDPAS